MTLRQYAFQQSGADQADGSVAPPGQVRNMLNCRLDRAGRIVRTAAWSVDWFTDPGGEAFAYDEHVIVAHNKWVAFFWYAYLQFATLDANGNWVKLQLTDFADRKVLPVEAPRSTELPVHVYRHVPACQIATTSVAGLYVMATAEYDGTTYWLVLQPITLVEGKAVAAGLPYRVNCGTQNPYPKAVGQYVFYNVQTSGHISITYSPTLRVWYTSGGGHASADRFDVCYTGDDSAFLLVSSDGYTATFTPGVGWSSWTNRSGAFSSPVAGTYAICTYSTYVWIACRCTITTAIPPSSVPTYRIASWTYSGWVADTGETDVSAAAGATENFRPELSRGTASTVWISAPITTNATWVTRGSLYLTRYTHACIGAYPLILSDTVAASHVLDMGNSRGSWVVVTVLRQYLRQTWLLWIDTVGAQSSQIGATHLWRGRVTLPWINDPQALSPLLMGQIASGVLGTSMGLLFGGIVNEDSSADITDYARKTSAAVATVYGMSGWDAINGMTVVDWAWSYDDTVSRVPELLGACSFEGTDMMSGGVPTAFGARPECTGATEQPQAPEVSESGSGTLANGVYRYRVTMRWTDSSGRLHLAPVSEESSVTVAAGHAVDIYIRGTTPHIGATDFYFEVYRTEAGGSTFYRTWDSYGYDWFGSDNDPLHVLDDKTDVELITHKPLYTQSANEGSATAIGGRLECWGAPPCRSIASGATRIVCGGLEQTTRIRQSNLLFPGEAPEFPEDPAFQSELPGDVVAVGALDDIAIAWTADGCFYIAGAGPDIQGNGEFDPPRQIAGAPGCMSARSVVHASEGVYWQGSDWQVWRLGRGTLQPVCVSLTYGERVYDPYHFGLNYGIADVAGDRRSYVVGAVREAETGLLFFARRAAPNVSNYNTTGGTLVFDPALGSWSCETDTGRSAISAGFYRYNGVTHPVVVTYLNSGQAQPEDDVLAALSPMPKDGAAGRFAPYNSYFGHDMVVDLGNVCPWESCGRGTVRRVGVLASSERASSNQPSGAHAWKGFSFWWRYDGEQVDVTVSLNNVTPATVQSNAGRWIFRAAPPRFRCSELAPVLWMRNSVTDNGDAELWLHALVVDADPIKGTRLRRRAGNERAS